MEKFKLKENIKADRIILLKRDHDHDEMMWQAIEESRNFIREYLFWVDSQKGISDVAKSTNMFANAWEKNDKWTYNIFTLDDFCLVGCIDVHNIQFLNRAAEFGYWLRPSETHKGYMTEAVLALEKELFKEGIHRLTICCDINNQPSANVAKRAGYQLESIAKEATYHPTGLHDLAVYVKFSPYPLSSF